MGNKYSIVRENFIKNFLNRNYLWTCVTRKEAVFDDMTDRSPFPFEYDYDNDILMLRLGNNINISFNFKWDTKISGVSHKYHLIQII